jgi:hypothetical protein
MRGDLQQLTLYEPNCRSNPLGCLNPKATCPGRPAAPLFDLTLGEAETPLTGAPRLSISMKGEKRTDGDVTEVRLAGVEVVDQVAAGRRRLGGLGRPGCVSTQPVVLLHIQRLRVLIPWIARHLRERRRDRQETENRTRR